jgi:DNA-binding NtrC family response regulator
MPGKDGGEVYAEIRELVPHMPIVLASGYSPDNTVQELVYRGNCVFVPKPFRGDELVRAVERLIVTRQSSSEA